MVGSFCFVLHSRLAGWMCFLLTLKGKEPINYSIGLFSLPDISGGVKDNASHPPPRVISSVSEKSFSFAVKQCMRVNRNGKPDTPRMWDTVSHARGIAQRIVKAAATKIPRLRLG